MAISVVDGFVITNATPVDARLVFTSSIALFSSGTTGLLPASRRYLGMEVYIVPETCSYTLVSGELRSGGGINNGIWFTSSNFSSTASYALNAKTASYWDYSSLSNSFVGWVTNDFQHKIQTGSTLPITAGYYPPQSGFDPSAYLSSSYFNLWTGSNTSSFSGTSSFSNISKFAWTASYFTTPNGELYFISTSAFANTTTSLAYIPTSSFDGCFINYILKAIPNLRGGTLTSVWYNSIINQSEVSTMDIGSTSGLSLNIILNGGNAILQAENSTNEIYQFKATLTNM